MIKVLILVGLFASIPIFALGFAWLCARAEDWIIRKPFRHRKQ